MVGDSIPTYNLCRSANSISCVVIEGEEKMAVKIRMKKISRTSSGRYNFRIAVIDREKARDGKTIEEIGYYDPSKSPASLKINKERYDYWLSKGAQPSETVASLCRKLK